MVARQSIFRLTWPVVGLSVLLTAACLASIGYIGWVQAELTRSLQADADRLQSAQFVQLRLREYRVHTVILAGGPADSRRREVADDRRRLRAAFASLRERIDHPADLAELTETVRKWEEYDAELLQDLESRSGFRSSEELSTWAERHRVAELLAPCDRLVERAEARMTATSAQSGEQARWAGGVLLAVGLLGSLAGLLAGYGIARGLSRRMAGLSSRVLEQERALVRAEQLAAAGRLAAGVAHEVRNPLTGIKMLIEAAARHDTPTPLTQTDLELIRDEIERMERTVQDLLDFAKPSTTIGPPRDLRPDVARAASLVQGKAGRKQVEVETRTASGPLVGRIAPDAFVSLLTNLLLNAIDASPDGGRVLVTATRNPHGGVQLQVTDSGPGISPEMADTLFTPFATTKPTGTGLGLAVARRVADAHGGTLAAANRPEGGACFTLTLPAPEAGHAEAAGG